MVKKIHIYTDGSYRYGFGGFGVFVDGIHPLNRSGKIPPQWRQTSFNAEVFALLQGLKACCSHSNYFTRCKYHYIVHCDHNAAIKLAQSILKPNTPESTKLVRLSTIYQNQIKEKGNSIKIVYIKGHSGNCFHNAADRLAYNAAA